MTIVSAFQVSIGAVKRVLSQPTFICRALGDDILCNMVESRTLISCNKVLENSSTNKVILNSDKNVIIKIGVLFLVQETLARICMI